MKSFLDLPQLRIGDLVAQLPIIQGGMGVGISLSGLASAVAQEGGVGVISAAMIGNAEPDIAKDPKGAHIRALTREIRRARELTQGVLGVNVMVALSNFADMVSTSVREGIDVLFCGAGLPLDLPKYVTEGARTKLAPIISSARAASVLCKKWMARFDRLPDAFVVEGPKAGGHLGFKADQIDDPAFSLERIVPEVVEAVKPYEDKVGHAIPTIAAGGIYTGEDICNFLELGAAGVQMGTRFVATHECDADEEFKQAYVKAGKEDIVIIQSPVGMPGRAVRGPFLDEVKEGKRRPAACPYKCIVTCDFTQSPYCIAQALVQAMKGKLKHGFAFAGANAWRVDKIVSVKELMGQLREEFMRFCGKTA